jgi:serine/threonine protein phosphatase PrpC
VTIKGMFRGDRDQDFFALFDGHGGRDAASHCAERLPFLVSEFLGKVANDPPAALRDAFARCSKEMAPWSTMMGTTAVVVLMIHGRRYIANLGDSKAILSQRGRLAFATNDHKASDPAEQQRVIELGGQIVNNRVNDKLSVTRALGDSNLAPLISSTPDVFEQPLSKYDEFLVLASDGVWDVLSPEEVVRLIVSRQKKSAFKDPDPLEAKLLAELVKEEAYSRGSKDNISVLVLLFPGFSRLRRTKKKSDLLVTSQSSLGGSGLSRSPSMESYTSVMSEIDPLYTTSDSELPAVESDDEDEPVFQSKKLVRTAVDDSVLDKLKSQYADLTTTPIASSFRAEMMGALEARDKKESSS